MAGRGRAGRPAGRGVMDIVNSEETILGRLEILRYQAGPSTAQ